MTLMKPPLRRFMLTAHITFSVGWMGAVVAFLALVVATMTSQDTQRVRTAWVTMEVIGWFAIVPLALASLFTGIVMSLGTKWGLFRYYWVLFSLGLTSLAVAVLLGNMQTVSFFANEMNATNVDSLQNGLKSELIHGGLGLVVLLVVQVLNVYKPQGMTPYGWRKQRNQSRALPAADVT
jgi:hypothetical protein